MARMPTSPPPGAPPAPAAHRPGTGRATVANARLTGLAGVTLLVLLAVQGVTIPAIGSMRSLHVFVGFLLIPPVLVKIASTGYRAVRYYTGDPDYRAAGAPQPLLRLLAPLVVVLTVVVLASGVALVAFGRSRPGWALAAHKASFILWFFVMTVHVLAYVWRAAGLAWADLSGRAGVRWRSARLAVVGASVVAGIALGVATLGWGAHFHRNRDRQGRGSDAIAGRPALSQAANASQRSLNGHQSQSTPVLAGKSHAP